MEKKAVVFDVKGKLACFKEFYTNSSALSYSFPPPTVIQGIIGSIIGLERKELRSVLKELETSVAILNPIKTIMMTINYIDTSETFWDASRKTQIPVQFLKNPAYRIFVIGNKENERLKELEDALKYRKNVFYVYLGMACCYAKYDYVFSSDAIGQSGKSEIYSVVPLKEGVILDFDALKSMQVHIQKEIVPAELDDARIPKRYIDTVLPADNKKTLFIKDGKYYKLNEYNVITF